MRKYLGILALLVIVSICLWYPSVPPVEAQRTFVKTVDRLNDAADGYSTVVCSVYINYTNVGGGYASFTPPTGYLFHRIDFIGMTCHDSQVCSLRVWSSATDSANMLGNPTGPFYADSTNRDYCFPVNFDSLSTEHYSFPIMCHKFTLTAVGATDDYAVTAYCKPE